MQRLRVSGRKIGVMIFLGRLYAFTDRKNSSAAWGAVLFYFLGFGLPVALISISFFRKMHLFSEFLPCLLFTMVLCGFANFLWESIPSRILLSTASAAESLFDGRRFILILWSIRQYEDLLGSVLTKRSDKDVGGDVYSDISLDSRLQNVARKSQCITIKLWSRGQPEPVGSEPKSLHVICDGCDWKAVVSAAMLGASAIVVVEGKQKFVEGTGLHWEIQRIQASQALKDKTVFYAGSEDALEDSLQRIIQAR
jgi:hypothetical protein